VIDSVYLEALGMKPSYTLQEDVCRCYLLKMTKTRAFSSRSVAHTLTVMIIVSARASAAAAYALKLEKYVNAISASVTICDDSHRSFKPSNLRLKRRDFHATLAPREVSTSYTSEMLASTLLNANV
jgi:hypothetical protein